METNEKKRLLNGMDASFLRQQCGNRIGQVVKKMSDLELAELEQKVQALRDSTFDSMMKGKTFPKLPILVLLANLSGRTMHSLIDDTFLEFRSARQYASLLTRLTDKQKMELLFRCWCERYDMLSLYSKKMLDMMFDPDQKNSSTLVGYLLMIQREKRNITKQRMAELLGCGKNTVANAERGNNTYSFINTYNSSIFFDAPVDFFYVGQLWDKSFVCDYMLNELFRGTTTVENIYFLKYIELNMEYKLL